MLQKYNFYRVLSVFLSNPSREFGWKELSEKLKLGPPSTKKYIDELKKEGIIEEKTFGAIRNDAALIKNISGERIKVIYSEHKVWLPK